MIIVKKNIKIIIMLSLSLILTSCGYKKINQKNASIIYIQNINVVGDRKISYILKNNILLISDSISENKYNLEIKTTKKKINKIKNTSGRVTRYNLSISANLKMINIDNKQIIYRIFVKKNDYEVATNHSKTITNENNALETTTQQLTDEIINFITLSMRRL